MRAFLLSLFACAACVTARPQLGEIHLRPYTQLSGFPDVFSVQQGRLLNPNVDLVVEEDGCVRGNFRSQAVQLCRKAGNLPPLEEGGLVEHWNGIGADVTVELQDFGKKLRMDGYVAGQTLQGTVLLGQGPQWDELRKHPVLLAIAAGEAGVMGEPMQHQGAE